MLSNLSSKEWSEVPIWKLPTRSTRPSLYIYKHVAICWPPTE